MLDPVFRIKRRQAALEDIPHALRHSSQVVGMHTVQPPLKVRLVIVGRVSEYCNQSGRAPQRICFYIPIVESASHGFGRQTKPLLAGAERCGSFGHAQFQFAVQLFELLRLAVEINKNADLCAQDFRNHGYRHIVHRSQFVTLEAIHFREVDGRNEDDRRLLVPWMLPYHAG